MSVNSSSSTKSVTLTAKRADSFVETIGVNTHLDTSSSYNDFKNLVKPRLLDLGVRYVRDGALTRPGMNADSPYYQRLRELASNGIKFSLITSIDTSWGEETDYSLLDDIYDWTDGAVASFEGINEPDLQPGVTNWVSETRSAQKELYETVKNNPLIKHVPVLGPSVSMKQDQIGDLSAWMDNGNIHPYYLGRNPETDGWGSNGYGSIPWQFKYSARPVSGSDPISATESGWHTTAGDIPQDIVAKYVPRLFLSHFNAGITRTYLYELIGGGTNPTDRESNFGLVNNDGTPKPAYTALKNLIDIVEDPGSSFQTGSLAFSLEGNTNNVEHTLLQKRNGDYYLALWLGEQGWDPDKKTRVTIPDRPITLELPDTIKGATAYSFQSNGNVTSSNMTLADNELDLKVKDTVTILKLSPGGNRTDPLQGGTSGTPTPAPTPAPATPTNNTVAVRYEAEQLNLTGYHFESNRNSGATGKGQVSLSDSGQQTGKVAGVFQGKSGTYNVRVAYYDENDGQGSIAVKVAGQSSKINLNRNLPVDYAHQQTKASKVTHTAINLKAGDRFELVGRADRGEYARIDYIEFTPTQSRKTAVAGVSKSEVMPESDRFKVDVYSGNQSADDDFTLTPMNAVGDRTASVDQSVAGTSNSFMNEVLRLTNEFRAQNGLAPLTLNGELNAAAQQYSRTMAQDDFFSHTGKDGSQPWDRAGAIGYEARAMGENIAAGQTTPQEVVQGWINSPGHRENLLNPNYTELGVGYFHMQNDTGKVNYRHYWTQLFGSGDTNPDSKLPRTTAVESSQVDLADPINGLQVQADDAGYTRAVLHQTLETGSAQPSQNAANPIDRNEIVPPYWANRDAVDPLLGDRSAYQFGTEDPADYLKSLGMNTERNSVPFGDRNRGALESVSVSNDANLNETLLREGVGASL
jgi:uncharacterized protein YkwD